MNPIYPCLWFDNQGLDAANFYCSIFKKSGIKSNNPMVTIFELEGLKFMALNGGPVFTFNPSISFFVTCETDEEINHLWNVLIEGGSALMPLGQYPWSENYAWLNDKFGLSWQLMKGTLNPGQPKISTCFLHVGEKFGKAEESIHFYSDIFEDYKLEHIEKYGEEPGQTAGTLKHGEYYLGSRRMMAMDGAGNHNFHFNESISFVIDCDTQDEIDFYWENLLKGGQESQCGWLKDQFGVSWQVVPTILAQLMSDPSKAPKVVDAFMKMKKFNIQALIDASSGM